MARSLGGTDADKIDCGTSSTLNPTTAMTFACWAYATSFPNAYNVITKRIDAGATHYYALSPKSTGKMALFYIDGSGSAFGYDGTGTNTLSTNTWYHLAFTLPPTAVAANGYVNGVLDGSTAAANTGGVATISAHTSLGYDTSTVNSGWAGRLAHAGFWNVVLTINELKALANGALPYQIRPTALVGYYPLDGLQSPEPDLSGNANNGTLTGTSLAAGPPVMQFTPRGRNALFAPTLQPFGSGISGSRSFNGSTDQIDLGSNSLLQLPNPATFSAWIYPTSFPNAYNAVIARADGAGGYLVAVKSTGKMAWYFAGDSPIDPGSTTLSTNTWYHILMTTHASGHQGFINGVSDGISASQASANGVPGTHSCIGFDGNTSGRVFAGRIAHAAYWSARLTAGEITALANGALPRDIRPTALIAWLPLDALSGPYPEPDIGVGNALNGTLTGTTPAAGPPVMQFSPRWPQFFLPPSPFTLMPQIVT